MIGPGNRTEFLKHFLEIDEVLFQVLPVDANQAQQLAHQESQRLARQNIIEKGLLRSFKDFLVAPAPVPVPAPVPAPPPPTQFENIMAGLGFYDPPTIRNHIIRPIFQSLNTIIQTVNGIGPGNIVNEIDILALAPQLGGAIQRKTRKQRKTHRGVKTRSTKPRKQSPRRHKKRSKKTRKH
jgi:hypothetical protein